MYFEVLPVGRRPASDAPTGAFLQTDNWNDWFKYQTLYALFFVDEKGECHNIGGVKIGQFGMQVGQSRPAIPDQFEGLDDRFFSLGQDDSYYETLNRLGEGIRRQILSSLRDLAVDTALFDRAILEDVTGESLLRTVPPAVVRGQFRRLASGGVRLTNYRFTYTAPRPRRLRAANVILSFE